MASRPWSASSGRRTAWKKKSSSTYDLCRHYRALRVNSECVDQQISQELIGGLSRYLLAMCLLKTCACCVRVSNHVADFRVALLSPSPANGGAGADFIWFCRLQRRRVVAPVPDSII